IVGQRVGQILRRLVLIEVLCVGEEIKDENFHVRGFLISAAELMVAFKFRAYSMAPATGMSGPVRTYSLALVREMRGAFSIAAVVAQPTPCAPPCTTAMIGIGQLRIAP